MKNIGKNISEIIKKIKEMKKTSKGRAILFFGFYFIFFLGIAILARMGPRNNNYVDNNNSGSNNNSLGISLIEQGNYKFNYNINIDGINYNYVGDKSNNSELFTVNGVGYYKNNDTYYTNASGNWLMSEDPYLFKDFLDIKKIDSVFSGATFISKTEYETGEVTYSYKILSANIVSELEGINIDIEEIPNEIMFTTNSNGDIYKIGIVLDSYGKYKKICNNTFTITIDYSDFGKVNEIVNPID